MGSRRAREHGRMDHYLVVLLAVAAGAALQMLSQDSGWAWGLGWVFTSAALLGGGLIYLLGVGGQGMFRSWGLRQGPHRGSGRGTASGTAAHVQSKEPTAGMSR